MTSLSERDKPTKRKGGHLSPPDRLCGLCSRKMAPAQTDDCCDQCRYMSGGIEIVMAHIRRCIPETRTLSTLQIVERLWTHYFSHNRMADPRTSEEKAKDLAVLQRIKERYVRAL